MNKEPKTQGKIEDLNKWIYKYGHASIHADQKLRAKAIQELDQFYQAQQQAQLQRVIELIGEDEDENVTNKKSKYGGATPIRNELRKQLIKKISQMGEEE